MPFYTPRYLVSWHSRNAPTPNAFWMHAQPFLGESADGFAGW
jgi:hypothetical protein